MMSHIHNVHVQCIVKLQYLGLIRFLCASYFVCFYTTGHLLCDQKWALGKKYFLTLLCFPPLILFSLHLLLLYWDFSVSFPVLLTFPFLRPWYYLNQTFFFKWGKGWGFRVYLVYCISSNHYKQHLYITSFYKHTCMYTTTRVLHRPPKWCFFSTNSPPQRTMQNQCMKFHTH